MRNCTQKEVWSHASQPWSMLGEGKPNTPYINYWFSGKNLKENYRFQDPSNRYASIYTTICNTWHVPRQNIYYNISRQVPGDLVCVGHRKLKASDLVYFRLEEQIDIQKRYGNRNNRNNETYMVLPGYHRCFSVIITRNPFNYRIYIQKNNFYFICDYHTENYTFFHMLKWLHLKTLLQVCNPKSP